VPTTADVARPDAQLHLAGFFGFGPAYVWSQAERNDVYYDFAAWRQLARTAERGLFSTLFLGDSQRLREHLGRVTDTSVTGRPDQLVLFAHLAAVTGRIGLVATLNTTFTDPVEPGTLAAAAAGGAPERSLTIHLTDFVYRGDADPSAPGGIAAVYRDLVADEARNQQVLADVLAALARGRHCLVLTQWTAHVALLAELLQAAGHQPVVLRGGMGAGQRRDALKRLQPGGGPLLVVATGPYVGEGFDCPALDTVFLAAPIAFKGRLVQYVGRVLRAAPGKHVVEVHDYHDHQTRVLASSLRKRAPGYRSLGFPDPSTTQHHQPGRPR
jgi:hypothetical protein